METRLKCREKHPRNGSITAVANEVKRLQLRRYCCIVKHSRTCSMKTSLLQYIGNLDRPYLILLFVLVNYHWIFQNKQFYNR